MEAHEFVDKSKVVSDTTALKEQSDQTETNLQQHRDLTNFDAMMIIFKTTVGLGIVTLPLAFMNAGLWVGFVGLFVAGAVQTHCMLLLVGTKRHLCERLGFNTLAYDEVAKFTFQVGHKRVRWFFNYAGSFVNVFMLMAQFGMNSGVLLFIGESCQEIFEYFFNIDLDLQFWLLFSFVVTLVFVFARTLKHMALFSLVANVGLFVSLVIILQHIVQDLPPASDYPIFNSWRTLPLYFGTVCFAFDSISVVLPTDNRVKHLEDYAGLTGVLSTAMNISIIFYAAVGFYGYLKYGDAVAASLTLNLPMGWLYLGVKATFVYSAYVASGLEYYVIVQTCWPLVEQRLTNETLKDKGEYIIRLVVIICIYVVAATVPRLDLMVSLTGALALSTTNLIIPATLDLVIRWSEDKSMLHWRLVKDILIIITGFMVLFTGTGVALVEIIQAYQ